MIERIHPQSEISNIGKNSCLVQCYIYCCGIGPDTKEYFRIIYDAIEAGVGKSGVSGDCTVEDAEKFILWLTGKRYKVTKKVCCNIGFITAPTPVRFVASGYTPHFAVVEDGEVVFDPWEDSNSVRLGKPESARVLTLDIGI